MINLKFERTALIKKDKLFCIINDFTITFDQFNASLLKENINSFKKNHTDCKLLNDSVNNQSKIKTHLIDPNYWEKKCTSATDDFLQNSKHINRILPLSDSSLYRKPLYYRNWSVSQI